MDDATERTSTPRPTYRPTDRPTDNKVPRRRDAGCHGQRHQQRRREHAFSEAVGGTVVPSPNGHWLALTAAAASQPPQPHAVLMRRRRSGAGKRPRSDVDQSFGRSRSAQIRASTVESLPYTKLQHLGVIDNGISQFKRYRRYRTYPGCSSALVEICRSSFRLKTVRRLQSLLFVGDGVGTDPVFDGRRLSTRRMPDATAVECCRLVYQRALHQEQVS